MLRARELQPTATAALLNMWEYLSTRLDARRARPGEDLLSRVVTSQLGDHAINKEQATALCATLLFGGLDTVAMMMGFIAHFLANHSGHRRQITADTKSLASAVEELIRRFGVAILPGCSRDAIWKNVLLKLGDQVLLPNALHGLDERSTPDPLDVNFGRDQPRHSALAAGIHTCPGAGLARREIRIFLEEWLRRIPIFRSSQVPRHTFRPEPLMASLGSTCVGHPEFGVS